MGILSWIVFGLIAGYVARLILPGRDPAGCVVTCLLGIAGAFVGGFIGTKMGFGTVTEFSIHSLGIAIVGALVVLAIGRMLRRA